MSMNKKGESAKPPMVSIVIPTYNASGFLRRCLESVLRQDDFQDFEVICVDDDSSDSTLQILELYQKEDSRVHVFSQKHAGPGVARNLGVEKANGEYVFFLDSDDTIVSGAVLKMACEKARTLELDLLLTPSRAADGDGSVTNLAGYINEDLLPKEDVFSAVDVARYLFQIVPGVPWGKLFRRMVLVDGGIRFPALSRSEDFPFVRLAMACSNRIGYFQNPVVSHCVGRVGSLENTCGEDPLAFVESNSYLLGELKRRGILETFAETVRKQSLMLLYYNFKKQQPEGRKVISDAFGRIDSEFELSLCPYNSSGVPHYNSAMRLASMLRRLQVNDGASDENDRRIHVAFIADEAFALPTGVAISSIRRNSNPGTAYCVHVLCYDVSEENLALLRKLEGENFDIDIIDVTGDGDYSQFTIKGFAVTPTAVFKFRLPELLPTVDKVLYLDGDVIVRKDLTGFWQTDISELYVAAVSGRGGFFHRGKTLKERLAYQYEDYFNSGVMLLNLDLMRQDDITDRLFEYRANGRNDFMDQDALNVVLGAKALFLPFKYNTTSICLRYSDAWHLNRIYPGTHLKSIDDAFEQSVVYHYSSPTKPWKHEGVRFQAAWDDEYAASPFSTVVLNREIRHPVECARRDALKNLIGEGRENALVSVVIPVADAQKTIGTCLESILSQDDFPWIEVICVDDGSTDNSSFVVLSKAYYDPRIVLVPQERLGADAARYHGIRAARTHCLLFLDADRTLSGVEVLRHAAEVSGGGRWRELPICPVPVSCAISERPYRAPDAVRLHYFNHWPNFGDAISTTLISRLTGRTVTYGQASDAELMGIGSVFGHGERFFSSEGGMAVDYPLDVWGSGFLDPAIPEGTIIHHRKLNVHAVRGKLSVAVLRKAGFLADDENPVLGDPGLICPDLIPGCMDISKKYDVAVIPHRRDQILGRQLADALRHAGYSVVLVDVVLEDPLESIRQIAASRKVLSSSLHGIIFADALSIPNRRVVFPDYETNECKRNEIPQFKFDDYYSAFDLSAPQPIKAEDVLSSPQAVIETISLKDFVPRTLIEDRKRSLLGAFPLPIDPAWREISENPIQKRRDSWPQGRRPRVLMACNPHLNPFMPVLFNELLSYDIDLDCGMPQFWTCAPEDYDVIHFQWADAMAGRTDSEFFSRVEELKRAGCRIAYTRHDACNHHEARTGTSRPNANMERVVDGVFHMGRYSIADFKARNPERQVRHYIVPHHLYPHIPRDVDRTFACRHLGLDPKRPVVMSFGDFRAEDERELVRNAIRDCGIDGVQLLAPRIDDRNRYISEAALPYYFAAADVVFVQRIRILNSGNVPMGFYFGKVVVGPNQGDVGEILQETGNPVFDPTQLETAAEVLAEGLRLSRESDLGEKNRVYADRVWSLRSVAERVVAAYAELCGCPPIGRSEVDPSKVFELGDALYLGQKLEMMQSRIEELRDCVRAGGLGSSGKLFAKLQASQKRRGELWNELEESRESRKKLREELSASQKRRGELWAQLEAAKKDRSEARAQLAESQNRRRELWSQLEAAKKDRSEARSQFAESQNRRRELWAQLEAAKKDRLEARAQFAESQKRRGELWKEREGYRKKFEEGEKRFKELAAEKQRLINVLRSVMDVCVCEEGK